MCKLLRNRTADRGDCGCEHKTTTFTLEYVKDNGTKLHPSRTGSGYRQTVHPRRSAAVELGLFDGRRVGRDALEGIPQLGVAARLLVRREIALEHAAAGAESFDAGLDILALRRGEVFGRRRDIALVEVEPGQAPTPAASEWEAKLIFGPPFSPPVWPKSVVTATPANTVEASSTVASPGPRNQPTVPTGGDMVEATIRMVDPNVSYNK